jgi:hypothetical protein
MKARVSTPTVDQILASLNAEVIRGRAYLTIAKGLKDADPIVLKCSPTFFGLAFEASLEMSQLYAAKLYDGTRRVVTVKSLLDAALAQAGTFKNGIPEKVRSAVQNASARIAGLQRILDTIKERRHKAIAHLDRETVTDPTSLTTREKLSISDLERVFAETDVTLNELSVLWNGTFGNLKFIGDDDYKTALELIAEAKHAQVDKWEKEFPNVPCDFPRPQTPRRPY